MSSTGVPPFNYAGGNLDGCNSLCIGRTDSQARSSTTTQDLTREPFYPGVGEFPHLDGVYLHPQTAMFSHPPPNTIAGAGWTVTDETRPLEDAVPSVSALHREVGNGETAEPPTGLPPSEASGAESSGLRRRTRAPTKSKAKSSKDNRRELFDPQLTGPIQVCISNPWSAHERSMTTFVLGHPLIPAWAA